MAAYDFQSIEKAKEAVLQQDLAIMRDAIDQFYSDIGNYPLDLEELVDRLAKASPVSRRWQARFRRR